MKKTLSLALALVMLVTLMVSVSSSAFAAEKITILYPGDETDRMTEFLEGEMHDKLLADLDMEIELIFVPWDQYWEQKDIMLAANEPIDLYWDGLPDLSTINNKKQCQPLEELINTYGQDMLKVLPMSQLDGGRVNGVLCGIPSAYAPSSAMFQLVCVREDILKAVGMTKIETAEDLMTFAQKTAEQFPEMKGPADVIFKPLTRYFADEQYFWVASEDLVVYGEESGKVYSYYETEAFQELSKFNREMYVNGLYGDETTVRYNERDSRMQTGLYLWVEGSLGKENEIIATVRQNAPTAELKSYLLAPEKPRYINTAGGEVLCVPYCATNPEGAIKFLNWLYSSQENYLFALYGVEGKDYEIVDGRIHSINGDEFFYEWMFRNQNYQLFTADVSEESIENYKHWDDTAKVSGMMGFSFDNTGFEAIEAACNQIAGNEMASIRGGFVDFETEYPKAVQALKDAGIDEYVAEVQRQLDAFNAAKAK